MSAKKLSKKFKPLPPHMKLGLDKFKFPNNDRYEGEFLADVHKKSYVRHGLGTYKTWDGQTYTGKWENDVFVKNTIVNIRYADKSIYTGLITNQMEYADDAATYQFYDGSKMKCKFVRNIPTEMSAEDGKIVFTDPNGIQWDNKLAELESDENELILCLPNTFASASTESQLNRDE